MLLKKSIVILMLMLNLKIHFKFKILIASMVTFVLKIIKIL